MAEKHPGKVFRIHVSGGQNSLFMLVCVFSPQPEETLRKYLHHAAVFQRAEPEHIPTLDESSTGIDVYIRAIKKVPGYELVNRIKLHPLDLTIVGEP